MAVFGSLCLESVLAVCNFLLYHQNGGFRFKGGCYKLVLFQWFSWFFVSGGLVGGT
jgi:hypothetical protein